MKLILCNYDETNWQSIEADSMLAENASLKKKKMEEQFTILKKQKQIFLHELGGVVDWGEWGGERWGIQCGGMLGGVRYECGVLWVGLVEVTCPSGVTLFSDSWRN
ncbi:hypothetical protein Tco_0922997 [Tanacetum coccineum]|uniref:Uncharacterized protein n=1 Tax=Tanacetum coccineum TaxID=301880 RepID=A0ABQ5D310_9ASTR